jgi:hypothetical protein
MKPEHALRVNRDLAGRTGNPFAVYLACGVRPLHLQSFLSAILPSN